MSANIVRALSKVYDQNDKKSKQSKIEPGEVTSIDPLRIRLKNNNKLILNRDMLSITSRITDLIHNERLWIGSRVLVLINKGGDEIYVIDRID